MRETKEAKLARLLEREKALDKVKEPPRVCRSLEREER